MDCACAATVGRADACDSTAKGGAPRRAPGRRRSPRRYNTRPMELDWEGLTVAFAARSMLMNHFLDRATGEVHAHLNGSHELREALLHERTGRFLRIPKSTRDVDAARCRAFAPRLESAEARAKAVLALESDRKSV